MKFKYMFYLMHLTDHFPFYIRIIGFISRDTASNENDIAVTENSADWNFRVKNNIKYLN